MVDAKRIVIGAIQVEVGFMMTFVDGPFPVADLLGGAVMYRGQQNIRRGWISGPTPTAKPSPLHPCMHFDPVSGVEMYA